jgi:transposase, IS5 family
LTPVIFWGDYHSSQKYREALKALGFSDIQNKTMMNNLLIARQLKRNKLITRLRYVIERISGSQVHWLSGKNLHYRGPVMHMPGIFYKP